MISNMKPKNIELNKQQLLCFTEQVGTQTWTSINGWSFKTEASGVGRLKQKAALSSGNGEICAPMPGQILKILVKNNQEVATGDSLFIVEAMKMEHTLKAPCSGIVTDLNFKDGDTVTGSDIILRVVSPKED